MVLIWYSSEKTKGKVGFRVHQSPTAYILPLDEIKIDWLSGDSIADWFRSAD